MSTDVQSKKSRKRVPPIQRLAIALNHPVRVRILAALVAGDSSASQLSREFGNVSVGDASYHLNVLADECRLLYRTRSRRVRGAVERFFRLKPGVTLSVAPVTVDREGMTEISNALEEAMGRVKRAEKNSRRRLERGGSTGIGVVVGTAAIQTAITSDLREIARAS